MKACTGQEIAGLVSNIISEKHQVGPYSLDLTVAGISVVEKEGDIDFGGSEEKAALTEKLEPEKRGGEDKFGWWTLTAGEYLVEFNEKVKVPKDHFAIVRTLPRALKAGVMHPEMTRLEGEVVDSTLLMVGKSGLNIKENARVSSLLMLKGIEK
jgi:deoxycytidine triphosphate deaminase